MADSYGFVLQVTYICVIASGIILCNYFSTQQSISQMIKIIRLSALSHDL